MPDAGGVKRPQHAGMRIAFDGVENTAGKQFQESLGSLTQDMGPQAIDGIAGLQSHDHAAHIVELPVHGRPSLLRTGF